MEDLNFKPIKTKDQNFRNTYSDTLKDFLFRYIYCDINIKWYILILTCFCGVGNLYCFDLPGALKSIIQLNFLDINEEDFDYKISMMYSYYALPNIIFPLIAGGLINKLGFRFMHIVFAILIS